MDAKAQGLCQVIVTVVSADHLPKVATMCRTLDALGLDTVAVPAACLAVEYQCLLTFTECKIHMCLCLCRQDSTEVHVCVGLYARIDVCIGEVVYGYE